MSKRSTPVFIRVTPKDHDYLRTLADDEGCSVGALIRRMVNAQLERQELPALTPIRDWRPRHG